MQMYRGSLYDICHFIISAGKDRMTWGCEPATANSLLRWRMEVSRVHRFHDVRTQYRSIVQGAFLHRGTLDAHHKCSELAVLQLL
jgi:hypothetical protein